MKLRKSDIGFSEAWIFGSWAKGISNENSDIDLAIVLTGNSKTFDLEVKMMTFRSGDETMIEPHVFNHEDFHKNNPFAWQVIHNGFRIEEF
jgi:predicted nucleotidyltransferase